jgi:hypothetical protein
VKNSQTPSTEKNKRAGRRASLAAAKEEDLVCVATIEVMKTAVMF